MAQAQAPAAPGLLGVLLHVLLLLGRLLWHRTEQNITGVRTSTSSMQYLCSAGEAEGRRSRQGFPEDGHTWMAPPRHGTEGVPSRLRLWSLLAAEPAVHEDHTQFLSQIPHRFWFWAPIDTRFGGREGPPSYHIHTKHVRINSTLYIVYVHVCKYTDSPI